MSSRTTPRRRRWRGLVVGGVLVALVAILGGTGLMERLFYQPTRGATPTPPEPPGGTSVRFTSADGTELHGWFFPAVTGSANAPTVLHVHGNAGNIGDHVFFTEFLPAAGINLFIFDYRGYGESAGAARRRDPLIADAHAALDTLLERDDIDPTRIGMLGQSLGAAIGLNLMGERSELRAGVLISGFASWRDVAADALGGGDPGPVARLIARCLIRDGRRPDDAIARIDRPLLIAHGDADEIVPVKHAQLLADAAPAATLVILPGGDHNGLRWSHPELDQIVVRFFQEHLPAK